MLPLDSFAIRKGTIKIIDGSQEVGQERISGTAREIYARILEIDKTHLAVYIDDACRAFDEMILA